MTAVQSPKKFDLSAVRKDGPGLQSRIVIYGVQGVGKSSMAAHAASPVFVNSKLETGIITLKDAGLVPPECAYFPNEVETWPDLMAVCGELENGQHTYKTAVFDVLNGFERICNEMVCASDYNGKMTSFLAYGNGPKVAAQQFKQFLIALDRIRVKRNMMIILLAHSKVKNYKNPEGSDYERFMADMDDNCWSIVQNWADIVLFANYFTVTKKDSNDDKVKGFDGSTRVLYTQRTAAWDAKNRDGLEAMIKMGESGKSAWDNFKTAISEARKRKTVATAS